MIPIPINRGEVKPSAPPLPFRMSERKYSKKRKHTVTKWHIGGRKPGPAPLFVPGGAVVPFSKRRRKIKGTRYSMGPTFLSTIPRRSNRTFVTSINKSYTAAASGQNAIYCNSIQAPYGTFGVSEQPVGKDQWEAFYGKYMVVHGLVEFNFVSKSGAAIVEHVTVWLSAVTGGLATRLDAACLPGARTIHLGGDSAVKKLLVRFNCAKVLGEKLDESLDGAAITANPTNLVYCHIWITSNGGNYDVDVETRIVQNTVLFAPKQFDRSVA